MVNRKRHDVGVTLAIAVRLRELRESKHLSQQVVSMDTGVNVGWVETGLRNLTISTITRLCSYYGVSLKEFFDAEAFAAPKEYDEI